MGGESSGSAIAFRKPLSAAPLLLHVERKEGLSYSVSLVETLFPRGGLCNRWILAGQIFPLCLLKKNGFDFDLSTYLIWEGNTMYLPEEIDKAVMVQLREHLRQFRLSFDYMAEAMITKTTGDPGMTRMVESFANMGAPWITGIDDIHALASEVKLRVIGV